MSLYSGFMSNDNQDLDRCFENLNLILKHSEPSPIKYQPSAPSTHRDVFQCSPSTLLPSYGELMNQPAPTLVTQEEDPEIARMREMLLST